MYSYSFYSNKSETLSKHLLEKFGIVIDSNVALMAAALMIDETGMSYCRDQIKDNSTVLRKFIMRHTGSKKLKHCNVLEIVAVLYGYDNWNVLSAKLESTKPVVKTKHDRGLKFTTPAMIEVKSPIAITRVAVKGNMLSYELGSIMGLPELEIYDLDINEHPLLAKLKIFIDKIKRPMRDTRELLMDTFHMLGDSYYIGWGGQHIWINNANDKDLTLARIISFFSEYAENYEHANSYLNNNYDTKVMKDATI